MTQSQKWPQNNDDQKVTRQMTVENTLERLKERIESRQTTCVGLGKNQPFRLKNADECWAWARNATCVRVDV